MGLGFVRCTNGRARRSAIPLVIALLLAACAGSDAEGDGGRSGDPIKLGWVLDLSGASADAGLNQQAGGRLAIQKLNDEGGVLGREVRMISRDDQLNPELSLSHARDLTDEGVAALFPGGSGQTLAITTVSQETGTPMIAHNGNTDAITLTNFQPYMASIVPSASMEAKGVAQGVADLGHSRIGLISFDFEGGHSITDAFKRFLKEFNPDVEFVEELYPPLDESNFSPYISSLLEAEADFVFSVLFTQGLISFTKQAAATPFFEETKFMSIYDLAVLGGLGEEAPVGHYTYDRAPFTALEGAEAEAMIQRFFEEHGRYPSWHSVLAYDAVMVWAQAVEEAGTIDGDAVMESLTSGSSFETLRGDLTIREIDHQADAPVYYATISPVDPKYGTPVFEDTVRIDGSDALLSPEEVEAAKGG